MTKNRLIPTPNTSTNNLIMSQCRNKCKKLLNMKQCGRVMSLVLWKLLGLYIAPCAWRRDVKLLKKNVRKTTKLQILATRFMGLAGTSLDFIDLKIVVAVLMSPHRAKESTCLVEKRKVREEIQLIQLKHPVQTICFWVLQTHFLLALQGRKMLRKKFSDSCQKELFQFD